MGMTQEHAAAAIHAAKMAQLNVMGHNLDKLPPGLLPPHLDLSKVNSQNNTSNSSPTSELTRLQSSGSVTIEPTNPKVPTSLSLHHSNSNNNMNNRADIRRESEPMDLGYENNQSHNMHDSRREGSLGGGNDNGGSNNNNLNIRNDESVHGGNNDGNSSAEEDNYSDDENNS